MMKMNLRQSLQIAYTGTQRNKIICCLWAHCPFWINADFFAINGAKVTLNLRLQQDKRLFILEQLKNLFATVSVPYFQ